MIRTVFLCQKLRCLGLQISDSLLSITLHPFRYKAKLGKLSILLIVCSDEFFTAACKQCGKNENPQ